MTAIGLGHYLGVAAVLFTIGVLGIFVNRRGPEAGKSHKS